MKFERGRLSKGYDGLPVRRLAPAHDRRFNARRSSCSLVMLSRRKPHIHFTLKAFHRDSRLRSSYSLRPLWGRRVGVEGACRMGAALRSDNFGAVTCSDLFWDHERFAAHPLQIRVRLRVARERLTRGIERQRPAKPVGQIAKMGEQR
jgi:hypothetical protein